MEYGYSCMGYELPGGMGAKLAAPDREVFVMVGDGSWLMAPGELVTAVAEGIKLVIVLVDNQGYASIGALSRSLGDAGFGTHYRRGANGGPALDAPDGEGRATELGELPIDLGASAAALGARLLRARTIDELREALERAKAEAGPGGGTRGGRSLRGRAELRELVGRARGGGGVRSVRAPGT